MLTLQELRDLTGYESFSDFNRNVSKASYSGHIDENGQKADSWKYDYVDVEGRKRRSAIKLTRDEMEAVIGKEEAFAGRSQCMTA